MAEHAEMFLSLYRADMDAALQVQPLDSWGSFPLFQLLNNFLRSDGECVFRCVDVTEDEGDPPTGRWNKCP